MAEDFIDLEWWRDPFGHFEISRDGKKICWIGRQGLLKYRPFKHPKWKDEIVDDFAAVASAEQALAFVKRYGFLSLDPTESVRLDALKPAALMQRHREGEEIAAILARARGLQGFQAEAAKGARNLYEGFKDHGSGLQMRVEVWLDPDDKTKTVRLRYSVWNLYKAIVLEALRSLTGGNARLCENCGKPFRVGHRAKRTQKSKFCTDDCKTKWHSLERTRRKHQ